MDFPYSQNDFSEKTEEVWKYINALSLESIFKLIGKFEDKSIRRDLMEVFNEKLRWASIPESVYVLDLVRKKFSLENYFIEESILNKIRGN